MYIIDFILYGSLLIFVEMNCSTMTLSGVHSVACNIMLLVKIPSSETVDLTHVSTDLSTISRT